MNRHAVETRSRIPDEPGYRTVASSNDTSAVAQLTRTGLFQQRVTLHAMPPLGLAGEPPTLGQYRAWRGWTEEDGWPQT